MAVCIQLYRCFAFLSGICCSGIVVAQQDGFWLGEAAKDVARKNAESAERVVFMIVVGGVIAAALIAAAIFFRQPPRQKD